MTSHTPGPWSFTNGQVVRVMAAGNSICGVHKRGRHSGCHDPYETLANARLIAAAPDLYEALRLMVASGENRATVENALAALAKAEGRS